MLGKKLGNEIKSYTTTYLALGEDDRIIVFMGQICVCRPQPGEDLIVMDGENRIFSG